MVAQQALEEPRVLAPVRGGTQPVLEVALLEALVRRVSWGGDRRRGVARIELGGEYAGTHITIEGEGRAVSVDIALAPGATVGELQARLRHRLAERGIALRAFEAR